MIKTPIVADCIYNAKETKDILGIHRQTLLIRIKNGQIPAKLIGNKYLIKGSDILDFLNNR
ncbi:MAG: hypothetical protein ACD_19C00187G0016 [uncultured bacterium]|nr:MAG: hypothetical protein ACD_19C00187G0016 [uncultured bacterium]